MQMLRKLIGGSRGLVAAVLLAACDGVSIGFIFSEDHHHARPLDFAHVAPRLHSGIGDRRLVVVRDIGAWDALWREHTAPIDPAPPLPAVNFAHEMVVGVFSGPRSNACYATSIESIWRRRDPDRIEVSYVETGPPAGALCAAVVTNPYALVTMPYSHLPVVFIEVRR